MSQPSLVATVGDLGFANLATSHTKNLAPRRLNLPETAQCRDEHRGDGPATIDGRQVSQFTITYAPGTYPKNELPFGELLEKECPEPVQVEMAIAASGLPIQVKLSTGYVKSGMTISSSTITRILATNFHFKPLQRPPASQTIGQAALRRFLAAKLSKELAKHKPHREAGRKTL